MTQEDVAVVEALWASWKRLELVPDQFAEDVQFHLAESHPEAARGSDQLSGLDAVTRSLRGYWEIVDDPWVRYEPAFEVGGRVLVRWTGGGRGRRSGLAIEWDLTHAYLVRDGKIAEVREFDEHDAALEFARAAVDDSQPRTVS